MVLDEGFFKFGSFLAISGEVYFSALTEAKSNKASALDFQPGVHIQNYFDRDSRFYSVQSWHVISIPTFLDLIQGELNLSLQDPPSLNETGTLNRRQSKLSSWRKPDIASFQAQFDRIRLKIQKGEWIKAVPIASSYREVYQTRKVDIINWIHNALNAVKINSNLMAYGWWNLDEGIIGITPEILYEVDGKIVRTAAIAGTRPISGNSSRLPLFEDPKELHEHQIVVEDIKQKLVPFGELTVYETHVVTLPKLEHLKTEIHLTPRPRFQNLDYSRVLHPTAALGVFPRLVGAIEELKTLPHQADRKRFGAPITFWLKPEKKVSLVMIRNVQWTHSEQRIFAGVGQVKDSEFEREWHELCDKINMVKTLIVGESE